VDIKELENIKEVVAYNNQSVAKRVLLSPSWVLGAGAGLTCGGLSLKHVFGKEETKDEVELGDFAKGCVNASFVTVPVVEPVLQAAFAGSAASATFSACGAAYFGVGILADAFGVGTGKPMGAMRAGYKQGKLGIFI
jgi:hypothetical protein